MRTRHFDLLTAKNDSVEYLKIITSIMKQLKNYQVRLYFKDCCKKTCIHFITKFFNITCD